jgi:DNA-binding transcriptional regulator PaaX
LDTLANRLGCGEKTVRRAIEDLVEHGAIKKHSRGRYQSSLYTVMTTPPKGSKMSGGGSKMSHEGSNMSTRLDKNVQVTRTTELEPIELEPHNDIVQAFNEFWEIYPRKQGKGKAKEAFIKATKVAHVDEVVAGAERYAADPNLPDPKFVPLPATWLNQERWDDGPLPLNRELTNSERNIQNFRAKLALLEEPMKEVESGQVTGGSITDFGVNLRSAEDY